MELNQTVCISILHHIGLFAKLTILTTLLTILNLLKLLNIQLLYVFNVVRKLDLEPFVSYVTICVFTLLIAEESTYNEFNRCYYNVLVA